MNLAYLCYDTESWRPRRPVIDAGGLSQLYHSHPITLPSIVYVFREFEFYLTDPVHVRDLFGQYIKTERFAVFVFYWIEIKIRSRLR